MAAVVAETKTTRSVIDVTFLSAPLHTPGNGVRMCTAWVGVFGRRGRCYVPPESFPLREGKGRENVKGFHSLMVFVQVS